MTGREIGWWAGGFGGAALMTWAEWNWTGGFAAQLWGLLLMLLVTIGFAAIGQYIGGFIDDTAEEIPDEFDDVLRELGE
jgi:hypothetical protein